MSIGPTAGSGTELVAFRVARQRWALPLAAVERVVAMVAVSPLPHSPSGVSGAINVHGEIVPVLDLGARFGFATREHDPGARLVLARTRRRAVAIGVDEVLGVLATDLPAWTAALSLHAGAVAGVAALPD